MKIRSSEGELESPNASSRRTKPEEVITTCLDSGADQCVANEDWTILREREVSINLTGFDGSYIECKKVADVAAVVESKTQQKCVLVVQEAYYLPQVAQSLLCPNHLREYGTIVDDCPPEYGGRGVVQIGDVELPLRRTKGGMELRIWRVSENDMEQLPILIATSPADRIGSEMHRMTATKRCDPTYMKEWKKRLGYVPMRVVEKTLAATTCLAKAEERGDVRHHWKARFPQLHHRRLRDSFATDTFFSDVVSTRGNTCFQLFYGTTSMYLYGQPMKRKSQAVSVFKDFTREVGAPAAIRSDNAKEEHSKQWTNILRDYAIRSEFTEPYHPHQNPAERSIGYIKTLALRIMDKSNCPGELWDYAVEHAIYVANITARKRLDWRTPAEALLGDTPDISPVCYKFYETVSYMEIATSPHGKLCEAQWLGVAESSGDKLTFKVLEEDRTGWLYGQH